MYRFLKLTDIIINTNAIQHICINKDKYIIHLMPNKIDGFFISYLYHTQVQVCKTNVIDYNKVTDWIDNKLN